MLQTLVCLMAYRQTPNIYLVCTQQTSENSFNISWSTNKPTGWHVGVNHCQTNTPYLQQRMRSILFTSHAYNCKPKEDTIFYIKNDDIDEVYTSVFDWK